MYNVCAAGKMAFINVRNQTKRKPIIYRVKSVYIESCQLNMRPHFNRTILTITTRSSCRKERMKNKHAFCFHFFRNRKLRCVIAKQQQYLRVYRIGIESQRILNMLTLCVGNNSNNVFFTNIMCYILGCTLCLILVPSLSLSGKLTIAFIHNCANITRTGFCFVLLTIKKLPKSIAQMTDFHAFFKITYIFMQLASVLGPFHLIKYTYSRQKIFYK